MKHRLLILGTLGEFERKCRRPAKKDTPPLSVTDIRMVQQENLQMRHSDPGNEMERIACLCREKRDRWDHHILFQTYLWNVW